MHQATKDMTLEWYQDAPEGLTLNALSIDTKLVGVLAASSVLIGVAAALGAGVDDRFKLGFSLINFSVACFAYLINFAGILWQIRPKDFEKCDDPTRPDMDLYWSQAPKKAREVRWKVLQRAYRTNRGVLDGKTAWLENSIHLLGAETIALIAWLVTASYGV